MKLDKYEFLYNAGAHFEAMDKYPEGIVAAMSKPYPQDYDALCFGLALCSRHAAAYRKYMGEDAKPVLTEEELKARLKPGDINKGRELVLMAVVHGMQDDSEKDGPVDLVLLEIEKQEREAGKKSD